MKSKAKLTRLWSILLVLVMLVGLLPATALAEGSTPATADFTDVTEANLATMLGLLGGEDKATWGGNTLTLKGVNFTTEAATAVKLPDGAKIVLAEGTTNTITGGNSASEGCYGIYAEGNLTIEGSGTLTVTAGTAEGKGSNDRSCGIYTDQALTISGGTVKAYGGATSKASLGIYSKNSIKISGTADVTAIGGTATDDGSFGINAEGEVIISGGEVKAIGGKGRGSDGIYSGISKVTINGGTVMAIGGVATGGGWSVGIYAYGGKVTINGGTVTSAADYNSSDYYTFNGSVTGNDIKTISFNRNGGSGKQMVAKISGETYTLPENVFTAPDDKVFKGWKVGEEIKAVGVTIDVSGSIPPVYAQWGDVEYTVTVTNGTASPSKAAADTTVTLNANKAPDGKVFDKWVAESGNVTFANENNEETTFKMPAGDVSVKATYKTLISISSVAITDIDAPASNAALDTTAACATTGVSSTTPTVTWAPNDSNAQYSTSYTASVKLTAGTGYVFANEVTATVNGNPASATKNGDGTLTVTYEFPATDKHNIEITFNSDVRGGDAATNPTISSGYEFAFCFFVEDTDKDGVFVDETTGSAVIDDKTFVVDKVLLDAFLEEAEMTFEEFQSAIGATIKTKFTGGCTYSVYAIVVHSDNAEFAYDEDNKVTNATVKVNGVDITDSCEADDSWIGIMPGAYVFTAATGGSTGGSSYTPPTYKVESEVSKDADGSVSFSKSSAKKGDTVTITVTPDRYYKVDGVTVKDKNGKEIAVTDNGDGTFTFKMPDSKVAVEPVFSWDNPFTDVAENTYYAPAVEWALKNDVTGGTTAATFSPNAGCTRAQIVTFLWRAAGCPEPADMGSFTDVSADAYYAKAVAWAVEQGITGGTGDGKFSPDAVCTRSQSMTFLYRTAGSPEVSDNASFSDVESNAYYAAAVAWAEQNDITGGIGGGLFGSANECTRAQIVAFLYRFFVK